MEHEYDELYDYVARQQYPDGFSKDQKRVLRRKASKYKVEQGLLFYCCKNQHYKQVIRTEQDKQRILEACHCLPEG